MVLEYVTVCTIYHNWYENNQNSEGFFPYLGLFWLMTDILEKLYRNVLISSQYGCCVPSFLLEIAQLGGQSLNDNIVTDLEIPY